MGPFIRTKNNIDKIYNNLLIALIPIILFSFYKNGIIPFINNKTDIIGLYYPLIFILIGTLSSYLIEKIYCKIFKKESYASIYPGLFIALVLPINTPIEILIFGCFIGVIVGKMLYGGFGNNIFNPALIGCMFILSSYSSIIMNNGGYLNSYEIDTIVVGIPINMNGTKTERVEVTEKFIHKLKCRLGKIEIHTVDERLTTVEAHKTMNFLDIDPRKKKSLVDTISAVYILETYMGSLKK